MNFYSLLPDHNEEVRIFFDITNRIGEHSLLIAVISISSRDEADTGESFIETFAENLAGSPLIKNVTFKNNGREFQSVFGTLLDYLPLFLQVEDLELLASHLTDEEIRHQVQQNKNLLMTPFGMAARDIIAADPLGIRELFEHRFTSPAAKQINSGRTGYFRTDDGSTYFIFISPHRPPQDLSFSRDLMKTVGHLERLSLEDVGLDSRSGIIVSYTGGYPIAVRDEATTKKDIAVTILTSFLAVLILFGISFRTTRVLFYVAASLVISILWTLGFTSIMFHHVNVLTCVFSCVLIGLGIDFAIHMVNRYFGNDKINLPPTLRLKETFHESGMGIVIGGITTAVAFYSIAISDFRGFQELGIVTGTGILICLAVMLVVLPCLLIFFSTQTKSGRPIMISRFGLEKPMRLCASYPKTIIAAFLFVTVLLSLSGFRVSFDDNLRNFRPADSETFHLQDMVSRWIGGSMAQTTIVVQGPSEKDVLKKSSQIFHAMKDLKQNGRIGGFTSLNRFIASAEEQKRTGQMIRSGGTAFDPDRIQETFNRACDENGFATAGLYDDYFNKLRKVLTSEEIILPSTLGETALAPLIKPFMAAMEKDYTIITYISPLKDLWHHTDTTAFRETVTAKLTEVGLNKGDYKLTGPNLLTGELKRLIISNLESSLLLALLAIAGVLILYYHSLALFLLSIVPLFIGLTTVAGIMVLAKLDFNFFNIIILPMIAGIGIDDGIHLTNTFRQVTGHNFLSDMARTGRAVVLTSLTTMAGFGTLALSHYPGLRSMGYVAVIGISACLMASIIILPALYTLILKWKKQANGAPS